MKRPDPSEFYVGYRKRAPRRLARFVKLAVGLLALVAVAVGATIAATQRPFEPGRFDFGRPESFTGTLFERPYPVLQLDPAVDQGSALVYLAAFGKQGAADQAAGLDGRRVRLTGTRIERGDQLMIELATGTIAAVEGPGATRPAVEELGERTLVGEIVDSKCYLGVMRPSRQRPHRACAALCIRGGIPPILATLGANGQRWHLLLTDLAGAPVHDRVLDLVAEPVEITGRVTRRGNLYYLSADPASYRRTG